MSLIQAKEYSHFINRHLSTSSDSFNYLHQSNLLNTPICDFLNQSLFNEVLASQSEVEFKSKIRQIRNAVLMKIATLDIESKNPTEYLIQTMQDTSNLARFLIDLAYQKAHQTLIQTYGIPVDENGNEQILMILALGKLGADELNFSSDVDLIFCYHKDGNTKAEKSYRSISNFEFFTKVGQKLIHYLSENLKDGFTYRVDMRLRPFGDSGPLASSFQSLEQYYQTHGRDWERYALIKASVIESINPATKTKQMDLMNGLNKIIKPFIYRRYLDFSVFESLRDMKTLIDAESKAARSSDHLKLGFGGIRLIEFIAQSYQLIYGGRTKSLQNNSLKQTLFELNNQNLIDKQKTQDLWQAYQFLRVAENRLQQRNDMQTHQLFKDEEQMKLLSLSVGFDNQADFCTKLDEHRTKVQGYFDELFKPKNTQQSNPWREIWLTGKDIEILIEQIKAKGKDDFLFLSESLKQARAQMSGVNVSAKLSKNLRTFMPLFLGVLEYYYFKHLKIHNNPELERQNTKLVFERVMQLIKRTSVSNVYLVMFNENIDLIKRICRMARVSQMLIDILSKNPFLIDLLLDRERLYELFSPQKVVKKLNYEYKGDLNDEMESLRIFNHQRVLSVASLDVMKSLPLAEVSNQLTYVTEGILKRVLYCAWIDVAPKFKDLSPNFPNDFCIVACGKFGGLEMSYNSDLDLIFLCKDDKHISFFTRLIQRMVHMLQITTNTGKLFTIDLRLRANGESGALVNPIDYWFDYEMNNAWVWEHQILCRARVVAGDENLANQFYQYKHQILCQKRNEAELKKEVLAMRKKMQSNLDLSNSTHFDLKQGSGGIIDIEFLVQFLLLNHTNQHPNLIQFSDNLRQIEALMDTKILKSKVGKKLIDCYFSLRSHIHSEVLQNKPSIIENEKVSEQREFVKKLWNQFLN